MIAARAESDSLELEQGEFYRKYGDKRFERFWRYLGLDLSLQKASEIYNRLLKNDLGGKNFAYIKRVEELNTAIHETKHIVDQIEHPELTLNLDAEFSAHVYNNYRTIRENAYFEPLDEFAEKVAGKL